MAANPIGTGYCLPSTEISWLFFIFATVAASTYRNRIRSAHGALRNRRHGAVNAPRLPRPASVAHPEEEVVIEPGFFYAWGDHGGGNGAGVAPICSNCDRLKIYYPGKLLTEAEPDRQTAPSS